MTQLAEKRSQNLASSPPSPSLAREGRGGRGERDEKREHRDNKHTFGNTTHLESYGSIFILRIFKHSFFWRHFCCLSFGEGSPVAAKSQTHEVHVICYFIPIPRNCLFYIKILTYLCVVEEKKENKDAKKGDTK